jgi:hypothetical protein
LLDEEVIYAFEYAMQSGLARGAFRAEAELPKPARAIVFAPIRDGCLRAAAAQNSDTGQKQERKKIIPAALSLSEVRNK